MVASRETFPLLAELLADQQRLQTPVALFSSAQDTTALSSPAARHASLIPLSAPLPGEQYAFEVDLDSCTGCKSCVAACHSLNGLDDDESWRDVGLLISARRSQPFSQTLTTACHHCADPACLNGCPVLAYEKDPVTGIVRHLEDQCIGCSYCVLKCPYDVPKFSSRLGIVRKCDMCHGRLAHGEAPACAQACPTQAIRIVTVPQAAHPAPAATAPRLELAGFRTLVPEADSVFPDPAYTQPTTRYVTARVFPAGLMASDAASLHPQPAHWPLVIMLTFLPAAVGLAWAAACWRALGWVHVTQYVTWASWAAGAAGLASSVLHLGQPRRAWRSFLGWRKSWLSREAIALGTWFGLATAALFDARLAGASALLGTVALACSAMVYIDTRRQFWTASQTVPRFFGTATVMALAIVAPLAAGLALLAKLVWESRTFVDHTISARLQEGPLSRVTLFREITGLAAAILLVANAGWPAFVLLAAGEFAERLLFFRAVDAPKMPGFPSASAVAEHRRP